MFQLDLYGRVGSPFEQERVGCICQIAVSVPRWVDMHAVLTVGMMFRRPSKLFRPSRVDTWAGLRQLALAADQTLSPSFLRGLMRSRSGISGLAKSLLPPMMVNTTLGFLLFTSHSFFALSLARLEWFAGREEVNLHSVVEGPKTVPKHSTLLSGLAGAGAGVVQGIAFVPVDRWTGGRLSNGWWDGWRWTVARDA